MAGTLTTEVQPDAAALRRERRERALAEMEADGIDVLILGREGNARYVAGAPRLWTAGSRPFTPGCVLVRATGDVHLLSTWDEGIPDDIPHEHLYGITFNPMNMVQVLQGVAGAATAARVATDSLTPMFAQLLPAAFPMAEIVDGEAAMRRARRIKTPAEVDEIRRSVAVAERCLAAAEAVLTAGTTERRLTGAFMEEMALAGVTTPSNQDVAWITSPEHPWRRGDRDAVVADGDVVVLGGGVVRGGYVGELARTHAVGGGHGPVLDRLAELRGELLAACRAGAPASALLDVYASGGVTPPPAPIARGLGLGFDLPIVAPDLPGTAAAEPLDVGVVFALTSFVWEPGTGAAIAVDPVHVTEHGAELLSSPAPSTSPTSAQEQA
ncbi:M24 family metallopeptidase [Dermatobacter hominis]|uniref:M24 family metallopeptidase n=1 Tax=Dermatobacter hominis TaxID=2884263 RepID=UPI001D122850|nr:M24 family metallopeptidase [Dermatobacter hominis]UDY36713.1 M24 family metallopeptidase [Dermatobacter hominis]